MENVRNRIKVELMKKDDNEKNIETQSKMTFNGIHKSLTIYDTYTFKQDEVLMDKPVCVGFAILELSKFLMYKIYYDKLQPCFGEKKLQLLYMDTGSFVLSVNKKDNIKDLNNLEKLFGLSNLKKKFEVSSKKNKKVFGNFKIETPKNIWIGEFFCLRSKMYVLKRGDDNKNKLKSISRSYLKNIEFDDYKKC